MKEFIKFVERNIGKRNEEEREMMEEIGIN